MGYQPSRWRLQVDLAICSKMDEFCSKMDEFCSKMDEFCSKMDEFCSKNEESFIQNDDLNRYCNALPEDRCISCGAQLGPSDNDARGPWRCRE